MIARRRVVPAPQRPTRPLLPAVVLAALALGACAGRGPAPDPSAVPTTAAGAGAPTTAAPSASSTSTTSTTTTSTSTTSTTTTRPEPAGLRSGSSGAEVVALQERLVELGYWLGTPDGTYGSLTVQAVMAFQKANGLARDGIAGPATLAALGTASRPTPRVLTGDGIEIDLERQLLLVVQGGQVRYVLNTSTGRSGWRTPPGDFTVVRQIDGMRHAPLGDLWRPKYFNGGIAIHGAASIPGQPASHGCARVSFAAMDMLWAEGLAEVGARVVVY